MTGPPVCAGAGKPAQKIVGEAVPVPAALGGQQRQNVAWFGRGICPTCAGVFAVDKAGIIRRHNAAAGAP